MDFQSLYGKRVRPTVKFTEPSRTKQSFAGECDINRIMKRYVSTGVLPGVGIPGTYGDFTGPSELLDAYELVKTAEAQFASLPAQVRERFRNRPSEFLAFVGDEKNREEAEKLGLLRPDPKGEELAKLKAVADQAAAAVIAAQEAAAKAAGGK